MCASYRDKERKSNFESFANKILTGIKEIDPPYAEKRAIWELFQNALDTIDDNGEIEILKTDIGFQFIHNGKAFKDVQIGGLIKQFSNGKKYGDNTENIGQYGTGFLSTHVYGKKVIINSAVIDDTGTYKKLEDFELDRSADNIEDLTNRLIQQDDQIADLCDNIDKEYTEYKQTVFEYVANDFNKKSIDVMLEYIHNILPYIFCFNEKLKKVTIRNEIIITYFNPQFEDDFFKLNKEIQSKVTLLEFKYVASSDLDLKIIIPDHIIDTPKLFLHFPLVDTSIIGFNFIIHANSFKPNRERDYLHLKGNNDEILNDVNTNEDLLSKAKLLIIDKIKNDNSLNLLPLCNIIFYPDETDFETDFKKELVQTIIEIKNISLFNNEKESINNIIFFKKEILDLTSEYIKSYYDLFSQFYDLPEYNNFIFLSERVNNWIENGFCNLSTISLKDFLLDIGNKTSYDLENINNLGAFKNILDSIKTNIALLKEVKIIPNIHNELCSYDRLVRWNEIEKPLIKVMTEINVDISQTYLNNDFYFLEAITGYSREDFKEDLSKYCNQLNDKLAKKEEIDLDFQKLSSSLLYFIHLNKTTDLNKDIAKFFEENLGYELSFDLITNPTNDTNYQPAIKLISRIYFLLQGSDLSENENKEVIIEQNLRLLKILNKNFNIKSELLEKLECIPNQNFILKSQVDLKIDVVFDEVFKDEYKRIVGEDIRNELADTRFNEFIQHKNIITGEGMGKDIEEAINASRTFLPIESNDKLKIILDLIKGISNNPDRWSKWLPYINKVKEEILMHKFKEEKTRNSLFTILSESEDKINLLGELAKISDLNSLIKAGKEKQREEKRKSKHFEYIKKIGLDIQLLIENQLNTELSQVYKLAESSNDTTLQTVEEQNGQDFIIYRTEKGTNDTIPVFYIEVKSRWDSEGIVALSKRQIECCARNSDKYAVITVNVADYKSRNNIVDEEITFDELKEDVYVNLDLSDEFYKLIKQNSLNEKVENQSKLIEFRGHIPQSKIKGELASSINFNDFINHLRTKLK